MFSCWALGIGRPRNWSGWNWPVGCWSACLHGEFLLSFLYRISVTLFQNYPWETYLSEFTWFSAGQSKPILLVKSCIWWQILYSSNSNLISHPVLLKLAALQFYSCQLSCGSMCLGADYQSCDVIYVGFLCVYNIISCRLWTFVDTAPERHEDLWF